MDTFAGASSAEKEFMPPAALVQAKTRKVRRTERLRLCERMAQQAEAIQ
jgi:hypothetical protein